MTDVKRLLDEATPLPWGVSSVRVGHDLHIRKGPRGGGIAIADVTTHPGPKGEPRSGNAALIVYAVNRLPDYEAAVDALVEWLENEDRHASRGGAFGRLVDESREKARAVLSRLRDEVPA